MHFHQPWETGFITCDQEMEPRVGGYADEEDYINYFHPPIKVIPTLLVARDY